MNKERVSIHISDSAQIFIEQTVGGTKVTKSAQLDDILLCLQSSIKPDAPASSAVLPPNALFYSHSPDTDAYSVALEYPYNTADITYMETEYVPVHRCRNDKLYAVTAFFVTLFFIS